MTYLVPNRECGPCRACCEALLIDDPQMTKLPDVLCRHRGSEGCAIYETRPDTCRVWYCGWRRIQSLVEEWRPDRSGIMIVPTSMAFPVRIDDGLQFNLLNGLEPLLWEPFIVTIIMLMRSGIPVYLAVQRGAGIQTLRTHLNVNAALQRAIANADLAAINAALRAAAEVCLTSPAAKLEFKYQAAE